MTLIWSGAADLPQVPFGRLFRRLDRPVPDGAEIVTAYTDGQVTLRSNRAKIGYHEAADLSGFKGVEVGDFVVHGLDILRGSVGVADSSGAITAVCTVCEPIVDLDPRYVAHVIRTQAKSGFTRALARGIREGGADFRRWGTLAELPIPVPPVEYQRGVCDYLDRETARIDTLIEEQQCLIEMLRERRAAALVDAFASMRDEGAIADHEPIPWLPELRIKQAKMRHICTIGTGSGDSVNAVDDGYPFFVRGDQPLALNTYEFDTEAIITAGDGAMVGRSFHHYKGKFAAHQRVYVLRDFKDVVPRYLFWYFSTFFIRVVGDGGAQATVPSVRMPMIAGMPVPIPSIDEQRRIAAYLDEQTAKIDTLITETERFIELARERRAALITAAVTGQVDVREMV